MESRDDQRRGAGNPAPATTYIILSRSGAGYLGSYESSSWVFHPDDAVDVAVCPTHVPPERFDIQHINLEEETATPEIFQREDIGYGEDVCMAGMFTRHIGATVNSPILRSGTLAGIPIDKVETGRGLVHAYFVEARSIAGLSGSPVFVQMAPYRVMSDGKVRTSKKTHYFLGIMQGHHITQDPVDVVSPDNYTPGDMNTGIGVVLPATYIRQVIDLPSLKKGREDIAKNKREGIKDGDRPPRANAAGAL